MVPSTRWLQVSAAVVALATAAFAQAPLPLPASHTALEGTASTNVPFGRSIPTRVQYVYGSALFAGPVTITGVQFRIDGGDVAAQKVVDCEIHASTLPVALTSLAPSFAQNRGADETAVVPRQLLTLPADSGAATPNGFLAPVTFTTPFAFDPQAGALVLEIVVHGQPPGAYSLDATYVCTSPEVPIGPVSCTQSNGLRLGVESVSTQVIWGRPWIVRTFDSQPGNLAVLALGTTETGSWAGMNLPQDLAVAGASGCYVSIDVAAAVYDVVANDGTASFQFAIPNNPNLLGAWLRFQGATFDVAANALGIVTSQAKKVQVCGWEPVGRVWSNGTSAAFGTREIGLAAVVQLVVQ